MTAPTGIAWSQIPINNASYADQLSEAARMCWRATHWIDGYCNQVLRGTVTTETHTGPGNWRLGVDPDSGAGLFLPSRWPVINPLNAQISGAQLPANWTLIPINEVGVAGGFNENPALSFDPGAAGADAYFIVISPGWVTWPRNSCRVQMVYYAGWPHTSLTQPCAAGDSTLYVDDVTGFAGLQPSIYDEPSDEVVTVESVTANSPVTLPSPSNVVIQTGPGTLTLSTPVEYSHPLNSMVTTQPYSIQQAAILHATVQALVRGASSIEAQKSTGKLLSTNSAGGDLLAQAKELIIPFKRVV
jgi:hypothetical protein